MGSELTYPCEPEELREYLVTFLAGKDDFSGAAVLSRQVANLAREIENSLARDGLLILVLMPSLRPKAWQTGTVLFDPVDIRVRVTENVLINQSRGGRGALWTACRVMAWLQNHSTPFDWCGIIQPVEMQEINILPSSPDEDESDDYSAWDCVFRTKLTLATTTIN